MTHGERSVQGAGTRFVGDDVDREITIGGRRLWISARSSPTEIELAEPYPGDSDDNVPYRLGPKRIGAPWRVRVPTSLVVLDELPFADDEP